MSVNNIDGELAYGNKGGYFYSQYVEGFISLYDNLKFTLNEPDLSYPFNLGEKIRDYQHALLILENGKELSKDSLDLVCSIRTLTLSVQR